MRGRLANRWHAADEAGKLAMLARAKETNCPLDMDLLDTDKAELDRLAAQAGLVPVFVATVDGCGLSCLTPGVVSPALADQYRSRKVSVLPTTGETGITAFERFARGACHLPENVPVNYDADWTKAGAFECVEALGHRNG